MCLSEFIDISPTNLDSSLCFIHPGFLMMYSAYKLNKQGDNIQPWHTSFPIWNQSVVPCPVLTVAWHLNNKYSLNNIMIEQLVLMFHWKLFNKTSKNKQNLGILKILLNHLGEKRRPSFIMSLFSLEITLNDNGRFFVQTLATFLRLNRS